MLRLRCLDVMQGSVRRNQPGMDIVTTPQLQHQFTIRSQAAHSGKPCGHRYKVLVDSHCETLCRFRAEDFSCIGCDSSVTVSLRGVLLKVGVRPSQDSGDVELIISTQNMTETVCIWSEHIIRSYKPSVTSLRSKLCQVIKIRNKIQPEYL